MKKNIVFILFLTCIVTLTSCSHSQEKTKKEVYLGIDVEILGIDKKNKILTVIGLEDYDKKFFDSTGKIDCTNLEENCKLFISKPDFSNIVLISFDDLKISDHIEVNISNDEFKKMQETGVAKVEQMELLSKD